MVREKRRLAWVLMIGSIFLVAGCGVPTPEVIVVTKEVPGETIIETLEVPVEVEVQVPGHTLTMWSTETERESAQQALGIIKRFSEETGIGVKLMLVDEKDIDNLMAANVAAGTAPDVVFFPLDFVDAWHAQGFLDADAASAVIERLGSATFAEGALTLVALDDLYAAVPCDGWGMLLVYRKDLFNQLGLEPPVDFTKLEVAAVALEQAGFIGIMAGTSPSHTYTQQSFEHFALGNGVRLIDDAGEIALNSPEMVDTLIFFTEMMAQHGPKDSDTTEERSRALYLAGQTGMTLLSPLFLDELAGLDPSALPNCAECPGDPAYLAKNSGFVAALSGPHGGPAAYGQVNYLGITRGAQREAAMAFVEFWLSDAYLDWLSVAPESKLPMRRGTAEAPRVFIEGWARLQVGRDRKASLSDFYDVGTLAAIVEGPGSFERWGLASGHSQLVAAMYDEFIIPQVIADIIDGYISPQRGAALIQARLEDLQAALGGN
jgi:multiple sugar transport system substrate-binding protein